MHGESVEDVSCYNHIHSDRSSRSRREGGPGPSLSKVSVSSLLVDAPLHNLFPLLNPFQPSLLALDFAEWEGRRLAELEQVEVGRGRFLRKGRRQSQ